MVKFIKNASKKFEAFLINSNKTLLFQ